MPELALACKSKTWLNHSSYTRVGRKYGRSWSSIILETVGMGIRGGTDQLGLSWALPGTREWGR